MTTRRRPAYIDPDVLQPPGRCLFSDGVYRRRLGWPPATEVLTEDELAQLDTTVLAVFEPRLRPGEHQRAGGL